MDTRSKIAVMQASEEGKAIEYNAINNGSRIWSPVFNPVWDWKTYVYRVKPEPKLRPYKNAEEFLQAQKEHGMYIKENDIYVIPVRIAYEKVCLHEGNGYVSFEYLLKYFQWQDGTPCGIMEEHTW